MWRLHRDLIEQDLHELFGIDTDLRDPMTHPLDLGGHSWSWLLVRVHGLLNRPSRLAYALTPPPPRKP